MSDLDLKEKFHLEPEDHPDVEVKKPLDFATDHYYNNPKSDLSSVANDGTCFQVDAWTMSKKR